MFRLFPPFFSHVVHVVHHVQRATSRVAAASSRRHLHFAFELNAQARCQLRLLFDETGVRPGKSRCELASGRSSLWGQTALTQRGKCGGRRFSLRTCKCNEESFRFEYTLLRLEQLLLLLLPCLLCLPAPAPVCAWLRARARRVGGLARHSLSFRRGACPSIPP